MEALKFTEDFAVVSREEDVLGAKLDGCEKLIALVKMFQAFQALLELQVSGVVFPFAVVAGELKVAEENGKELLVVVRILSNVLPKM